MTGVHVKSLKVFCDVVNRRSFSRAADENGITQPGASQIVQQLEEHLGVKLIDRSKRPFLLTPEGKIYYEGCRKVVQKIFALEEEVRTLHQEVAGRVHVASIYSVGLSHMSQIVQEFLAKHPKANVRLEYQHPDRVYELVKNGQVDLGLVSYPKSSRMLKAIPWRREPMVFVCAPSHPLSQHSSIELSDVRDMAMVGFDDGLKIRHEIDKVLAAHRVEVSVVMEFDNIETLKRAVEINSGFSLLPEPTVRGEVSGESLVALPLRGVELARPVGILQRRNAQLGKTARRFMQLLLARSQSPSEKTTGPWRSPEQETELVPDRQPIRTSVSG